MSKRFDFTTQHCGNSTEANIFIHGYSAGHNDSDRQTLLGSIPESFHQHTNIFAFWPSSHYAHFDLASLLNISTGLSLVALPASGAMRGFGLAGSLAKDRVNNFTEARTRAEHMGALLFIQLYEYLKQHHPEINTLNLIGHSLGGRLVVSSLRTLRTNLHPRLTVNDVLLMAAAVEVQPGEAHSMRSLIKGRLINAYSTDDWTLLMPLDEKCLGRREVEHFENMQIDEFGHGDYWRKLPEVFSRTAFKTNSAAPTHATTITTQTLPIEFPSNENAMPLELKTPSEIYQRINSELLQIVTALNSQSSDATLNKAQNDARELLTQYQTELHTQLAELEKNAEWKTFTIAFYGETGAGKSTIIETLRILLQERSKLANQQEFRELRERYGLSEEKLQQLRQAIEQADARLDELAQQLNAALQLYEQPYLIAQQAIEQADRQQSERAQRLTAELQQHERQHADTIAAATQLQALIAKRKHTASLWQKLLNLFSKTPEEIELSQIQSKLCAAIAARDETRTALSSEQDQANQNRLSLERQLSEIARDRDNTSAALLVQQAEAEQNKLALVQQHQSIASQMEELLAELEQHADGEIIGDGRADFTRQTQRYDFELDGQPFALLDVPGIEGKEGLVLGQIEQAVQTAHAVFYVTNQAAPPQTGDEQRKGTLEKIKEHLGAQTEVWTIFNKKITNPKHSLTGRPLTSDDENISLNGLNEKMREQLGEHYREVFPLTALPAFLASTDHFAPQSQNARRRSKILEDFAADDLLEKSRLHAFLQFLSGQLIRDSKAKITRANFNKAKDALDQAREVLDGEQRKLAELSTQLKHDADSAKTQLNSSFQALKTRLEAGGETLIDNFASSVRNKVYALIDDDISNDYFKGSLRDKIDTEQQKLNERLPEALGKEVEGFQKDAEYIINRFESQAQELTAIYSKLGHTRLNEKFNFKIKIDNGIKVAGLLGGLIGIALAPFTGGASLWLMGLSGLTMLVSVGKALWSAFSSDYKKSQQRKSTDDNLRNITQQLRDSLLDGLKNALSEIQQKIDQIEQALESPAKQADTQVQALIRSVHQLNALSRQIDNAGKR
ncbi:DUF726 domain-containing protein [Stutzerimonas nitrititolerans]|uniref:DUF726 domain-containing protein n=1 Tax=Stutzerimonas nitrititolerans TaxID=2482751 RepID=A0ABX9VAD0_9GAMM|nr:DUF726 domain-containing protein [Stutzerimonas nitrititolerans]RMI03159.1 DUF726 domain-containing protein [Stutzerimonas nitrititolerans]